MTAADAAQTHKSLIAPPEAIVFANYVTYSEMRRIRVARQAGTVRPRRLTRCSAQDRRLRYVLIRGSDRRGGGGGGEGDLLLGKPLAPWDGEVRTYSMVWTT